MNFVICFFTFSRANAVMSLENQIKNVGMSLIELEEQLARDTIILDKPDALEDHINMLEVRGRK